MSPIIGSSADQGACTACLFRMQQRPGTQTQLPVILWGALGLAVAFGEGPNLLLAPGSVPCPLEPGPSEGAARCS